MHAFLRWGTDMAGMARHVNSGLTRCTSRTNARRRRLVPCHVLDLVSTLQFIKTFVVADTPVLVFDL